MTAGVLNYLGPKPSLNLVSIPTETWFSEEIIAQALNVRQAEQRSQKKAKVRRQSRSDADSRALESSLSSSLGLKAQILHKGSTGGELRITYRTLEQLDDLIQRLNSPK